MSDGNSLGFGSPDLGQQDQVRIEYVIVQKALHRVLAFTGRTIDDVVNDPVARNHVRGYFKLHRWVERQSEISEMERAWNPLGYRT
jgi:hypothetical protein